MDQRLYGWNGLRAVSGLHGVLQAINESMEMLTDDEKASLQIELANYYSKFATKPTEDEAIIKASGQYLCESLPDDFQDMDEDDLWQWIEDNACETYESMDGKYIFDLIDGAARHLVL